MANEVSTVVTPREAIERIKEKFPAEAGVLASVVQNNIIVLGENELFTLRDKQGEIRAFKRLLRLSLQNGGLVNIPVGGGTPIISAEGYEMWAESAGASVIFPAEVLVYGRPQANPAPLPPVDPVTGEGQGWFVRAVAFKLSSMGIPQVADRTVVFDIKNRQSIEFLAKAKDYPQAFQVRAAEDEKPTEEGRWIKYPFDKVAVLWVNAAHKEALKWYAEISQMFKNSLQLAQTYAARNALKHLSGLQKSPGKAPVWDIPVIAWRPEGGSIIKWDPTTYKNLQSTVSGMISGDRKEFKAIELTQGVDTIGDEDVQAMAAAGTDTDAGDEVNQQGPVEPERNEQEPEVLPPVGEEKKPEVGPSGAPPATDAPTIIKQLAETKKQFKVEYATALKNLGIDPKATLTLPQAGKIMAEVHRIVDELNR
jgi:hypothetical protein